MNTQFSIPDAGCKIAITFEFPSHVIGTATVNKTTITGVVEKATKFTPPNFVRIVTDFDSPVRIREIPLHRVTNIEYADGRTAEQETVNPDTEIKLQKSTVTVAEATDTQFAKQFIESTTGIALA